MNQKNFTIVIVVLLTFLLSATTHAQNKRTAPAARTRAPLTHELTIYVDEGHGKPNGHVWIGLGSRDGSDTSYHGFYPVSNDVGIPNIFKPGQVRDDSQRVEGNAWDVKRTYNITEEAYHRALDAIRAWQNQDQRRWDFLTHCGDFTEGIAKAAGVGTDLPWTKTGKTRPGVFGEYLRNHGGVVNEAKEESAKEDDQSKGNNWRAGRGNLKADGVTKTTSNLARATFTNNAQSPMSVLIGGTANENFTVPPGGSKTVDITPGLNMVVISSPDNRALPTDGMFTFQRGMWHKFSYSIIE